VIPSIVGLDVIAALSSRVHVMWGAADGIVDPVHGRAWRYRATG
jgi:hypothetical protein